MRCAFLTNCIIAVPYAQQMEVMKADFEADRGGWRDGRDDAPDSTASALLSATKQYVGEILFGLKKRTPTLGGLSWHHINIKGESRRFDKVAFMSSSEEKHQHDYGLLEELTTKPRTTYLARFRNPNPEMAI